MVRSLVVFFAAVTVAMAADARAAPQAVLWERWTAHDEASQTAVDHRPWQAFLDRFVVVGEDGIHRILYGKVGTAERGALSAYVSILATTPVGRLRRDEQRAFWINLYNALTVTVVLDRYPVKSIRDIDISPGLFADGPWGRKLLRIEGEDVSLDDIEHRILRPIWNDPRLHYAVNCAAHGCPNLQRLAFTPANADSLLEKAAAEFVNHRRGARVEPGRLVVSSIYVWFQEDFGGGEAGVIAHLKRHAAPGLGAALATIDRIAGHDYDWRLNDAP